jgi:predicted secreted protein
MFKKNVCLGLQMTTVVAAAMPINKIESISIFLVDTNSNPSP